MQSRAAVSIFQTAGCNVCALDDIRAPCRALEAECAVGPFEREARARRLLRRTRSFMHVASTLQRRWARRCPTVVQRILAWHKENCVARRIAAGVDIW